MRALEDVAPVVDVGEGDFLLAAALQNDLLVFLAQFLEGRVDIESLVLRQGGEHVEVVHVAPVPAADGALRQTGLGMQHDSLGIKVLFDTQPVATAAGAGGVVE
jgi:hypothetical protein